MNSMARSRRLADVVEEAQHLRLDRDVERRDRLVGDQELGLHRQGAGDADALPLAARELVRIALERVRVELDQRHSRRARVQRLGTCGRPKLTGPSMIDWPTVRRGLSER